VATRWNSLYDSLKALLEHRRVINILSDQLKIRQILDDDDFAYMDDYLKCAEPIATALDKVQGEGEAFYGMLLPTLYVLKRNLDSLSRSNLRFCEPMADGYLASLELRFNEEFNCRSARGDNAALAALCLPRFKDKWFPCIPQPDRDYLLGRFRDLIGSQLTTADPVDSEPMEIDDYYDFGEVFETSGSSQHGHADEGQALMLAYLKDKRKDTCMLKDYPPIERLFLQLNTAPPSSAQVERLFSYATMINAPKCNRLGDEKFEQRVLLRVNETLI
jgi:hypothetical protein